MAFRQETAAATVTATATALRELWTELPRASQRDIRLTIEKARLDPYKSPEPNRSSGLTRLLEGIADTRELPPAVIEALRAGEGPPSTGAARISDDEYARAVEAVNRILHLVAAVVVGIDDYRSVRGPELRYAVADATAVAGLLHNLVAPGEIVQLLERDATRGRILAECRRLIESGLAEEIVLYLSGLRFAVPSEGEVYRDIGLITANSQPANPDTGLRHADLLEVFQDFPGHVTLILDTGADGSQLLIRRTPPNITVLAASRDNEESVEDANLRHGAFTGELINILNDWTPQTTWGEVYLKVFGRVVARYPKQHPMLIGDGGVRVFGGGARGEWEPALPVLRSDGELVEVYASPALRIAEGWQGMDAAAQERASALWLREAEGIRLRFGQRRPAPSGTSPGDTTVNPRWGLASLGWTSEREDLRPVLAGLPPLRHDAQEPDVVISGSPQGFTVTAPDGIPLLEVSAPEIKSRIPGARETGFLVTQLNNLAALRHFRFLSNTDPYAPPHATLTLESRADAPELTVTAGQPFTIVAANRDKEPAFISVWQLHGDGAVRQIHPATTDCDILYPDGTLSLSVTVDETGGGRALYKLVATEEPHDLRMLGQGPIESVTGDLLAWLAPDEEADVSPYQNMAQQASRSNIGARNTGPAARPEPGLLPGTGLKAKLWQPGQTLRIRFLEGEPALHERILRIARELTEYAYLFFEVVHQGEAEVRISFSQPGAWSYVGTDALAVAGDQPTMNFGWVNTGTEEKEVRRVVLSEFGQMLGLIHDHQNPNARLPWNRERVLRDLSGPPNFWTAQQVEQVVFTTYRPQELAMPKSFDAESIMSWQIPAAWLDGAMNIPGSQGRLTHLDRQALVALYPQPAYEQNYTQNVA
jgi:serralysin